VHAEEIWEDGLARSRDGGLMLPLPYARRLHEALYSSFVTLADTIDRDFFISTYRYPGATERAISTVEYLVRFFSLASTTRTPVADFLTYARPRVGENRDWPSEADEVGIIWFATRCSLDFLQFSHTWDVLHRAIGFAPSKSYAKVQYAFFNDITATQFLPCRKSTVFDFTLADLRRLDIGILPTKFMEDHFKLEGDKVKILMMGEHVGGHLNKLKYNALAR
jgi:hypothetical protein